MTNEIIDQNFKNPRGHVVFDNDGTMIDSLTNFYELALDLFPKHLGRPVTSEELKEAYVPDWHQLFINLGIENPSEDFIQAVIDDLNEINKDYVPDLIPGTKEFITDLHSMKLNTYVWTGRDQESGLQVFKALGLMKYFKDMQFRDTSKAKPDPEGLAVMFPTTPKDKILLIGDSIVDIKGAKAFGIDCLIVDWFGHENHDELMAAGASKIVTTHEDALEFIKNKFS